MVEVCILNDFVFLFCTDDIRRFSLGGTFPTGVWKQENHRHPDGLDILVSTTNSGNKKTSVMLLIK